MVPVSVSGMTHSPTASAAFLVETLLASHFGCCTDLRLVCLPRSLTSSVHLLLCGPLPLKKANETTSKPAQAKGPIPKSLPWHAMISNILLPFQLHLIPTHLCSNYTGYIFFIHSLYTFTPYCMDPGYSVCLEGPGCPLPDQKF